MMDLNDHPKARFWITIGGYLLATVLGLFTAGVLAGERERVRELVADYVERHDELRVRAIIDRELRERRVPSETHFELLKTDVHGLGLQLDRLGARQESADVKLDDLKRSVDRLVWQVEQMREEAR